MVSTFVGLQSDPSPHRQFRGEMATPSRRSPPAMPLPAPAPISYEQPHT